LLSRSILGAVRSNLASGGSASRERVDLVVPIGRWRLWRRVPTGAAVLLLAVTLSGCGSKTPQELLTEGRSLQAKGERNAAVIQYKAALQLDPKLHEARVALAQVLAPLGQIEAAIVELDRVVVEAPDTPGVFALLSRYLSVSADPKRAMHRLSALKPKSKADQATVLAHLAATWAELGDEGKATESLRKAFEVDPENLWANLYEARRAFFAGQSADAEARVDRLLAKNADFAEALYLKGQIRQLGKDEAAATAHWKRAIAARPDFVAAHEALAAASLARKDVAAAKSQLDALRQVSPGHPTAALIEARILIAEDKLAEARERVLKLLALAPDHQGLLTLAGALESRVGSPLQAASLLRKAVTANPDLEASRSELAEVELRLGQPAAALKTLQPLLSVPKPGKRYLVMASDAQLRLGNPEEADKLLRQAAAAAPNDEQLQAATLVRRMQRGDVDGSMLELQSLAARSGDTFADEALVLVRLSRRELDAAHQALDALERKSPGGASVSELRGRAFFAQRKLDPAIAAFEQALQRDKGRFSALSALVLIDQLQNKPDRAVKRLQALLDNEPQNAVALVTLAEVKSRSGSPPEEVVALLNRAVTAAPTWADPRRRLIEMSLNRRQYKQALDVAQAALAALPGDDAILAAAGRAQYLSGDVEQAVKTLRRRVEVSANAAAPQLDLARVYATQGRNDAAEAAFRRAAELEPFNEAAQQAFIDHLVKSRKGSEAADHVRRLRQLRPNDPLSYALLASYQVRVEQREAAVATLKEGLTRTRRTEFARRLYVLQLQMKQEVAADAFARDWIAQFPDDIPFLQLMATRDVSKGDFKSAEVRLRRVVEFMPSNAAALNNLAWIVSKAGGPDALEFARRAVALAPDDAGVLDTLAQALSVVGQHQEALAVQRRAVDMEPSNDLLKLGLARVGLAAGDKALARTQLEPLRKLGKSFIAHDEVEALAARL
jgi:cellulose synthase operon protein C